MLEEALEYFRKLEDVIFVTEYDNGESHEDHLTSVNRQGYYSIDELVKEESKDDMVVTAHKNQGDVFQPIEEGDHYTIFFAPDKNSIRIKKMRDKFQKMEEGMRGEGQEEFKKLSEKEQNKKWDKYNELSLELQRIDYDYSHSKVIVIEIK